MPSLKNSTVIVICMKNRKEYIQKELAKNGVRDFLLIDAIDGKQMGENYLQNQLISQVGKCWVQPYGQTIISKKVMAKMGCFLSHLKALKVGSERSDQGVFILEDDCVLSKGLADLDIEVPQGSDIIYLGGFYDKKDKTKDLKFKVGLNQIISEDIKFWTAHAYYVNCPSLLLAQLRDKRPKAYDALLISLIQKRNRSYFYSPSLVTQNKELVSNIDPQNKYSRFTFF